MLHKIRAEIDNLQDHDVLHKSSYSALMEELQRAKENRLEAESTLAEYEKKHEKLKNEIENLKEQLDSHSKNLEDAAQEENIQKEHELTVQEISKNNREYKDKEKELSKLNSDKKALENKRNKYDDEMQMMEFELEKLIEENKKLGLDYDVMKYTISEDERDKIRPELKISSTLDSDDAFIEEPEEDIQDMERLKHLLLEERRKKYEVDDKISRMENKVTRLGKPTSIEIEGAITPSTTSSVRRTVRSSRRVSDVPSSGGKHRSTFRYIRKEVPQTVSTTKHRRRLSNVDQDTVREGTRFLNRQGTESEFKSPERVLGKRKRSVDVNDVGQKKRRVTYVV